MTLVNNRKALRECAGSLERPGGIVKRSLAMAGLGVRTTIAKAYGLDDATRSHLPLTIHLRLIVLMGLVGSLGLAGASSLARAGAALSLRPRLLVLTDIGGDPDDQQSMIRLMVHANEFEIEGLIATASGTPGELKEQRTRPDLIHEIVTAYGQVQPQLAQHAPGFPPAAELLARIKSGNPNRGRDVVGDAHDTEGSRWIVACGDQPDRRPLNIVIWGGQTDLAQALWRVRHERGAAGLQQFQARLRIYDIGDQDGIFAWMWGEFPGMFYVLGQALPGQDKRLGVYRGMYLTGDESLTSRAWIDEHVRQNHGPLGALYPPKTWTVPNPHSALKEGDTPSWFFFLPNGLGDPAHPDWGGWGGRFTENNAGIWRDAQDTLDGKPDARLTVSRWRPAFQNEFAARMDWCVQPRSEANHPPVAVLNGDVTRSVLGLDAVPGQLVTLSAKGSYDPDGRPMRMQWFVYPEAGTYRGTIRLSETAAEITGFLTPIVEQAQTIHVILVVEDQGRPPLSAYRRAVVTGRPTRIERKQ